MGDAAWLDYLTAMRAHLAHAERLAGSLPYFVGDDFAQPRDPSGRNSQAWLDLLREAAELARRHREALESLLGVSRPARGP